MFVSLHLTGHALVYAGQLTGLRMFIDGVVKARVLCGKQHFRKQPQLKVLARVLMEYLDMELLALVFSYSGLWKEYI